jgi:hypothetical protein
MGENGIVGLYKFLRKKERGGKREESSSSFPHSYNA